MPGESSGRLGPTITMHRNRIRADAASIPAEPTRPEHVRAPMPSDAALGRKLRELRRQRGLTQKELAGSVGITGAQLHRYEVGATRVAASRLIAMAEALGVRPDVLLDAAAPDIPQVAAGETSAEDDLVELINLFSAIADPRGRQAILAVARMMAVPPASGGGGTD